METKLDAISNAINEIEDYSYQFNIKLIGVPETSANESSRSTSSLYFKRFNDMGAKVTILDIDTAHRVPSRSDCGSSQNRSFANFLRCLVKERVTECRKDTGSVNPSAIGLPDQASLSEVKIFYHLMPKMQSILYEAEKFKNQHHYKYCWAKNSVVYSRNDATARLIKIKGMNDVQRLVDQSSTLQVRSVV